MGRRTGFFSSTASGTQSFGGATWEPVSFTADDLLSSEPQRATQELDQGWTHFNDVFPWNSDHLAIWSFVQRLTTDGTDFTDTDGRLIPRRPVPFFMAVASKNIPAIRRPQSVARGALTV